MAENVGTTNSTTSMTYEQWLQQARTKAGQTRDAAIANANINYQKSRSEYGSRAATLENMGLTGSGYSEYLNGKAYAEMQGAISNAYAQESQTNFDLDTAYMQYLEQKRAQAEQEKKQAYASLYDGVKNGLYNGTDILNLSSTYGLDESQVANLKNAYLEGGNYTVDDLNALYGVGGTSGVYDDYDKYYNKIFESLTSSVTDGMFDSLDSKEEATAYYESIMKELDAAMAVASEGNKKTLEDVKSKLTSAYKTATNKDSEGNVTWTNNPITVSSNVKFKSDTKGKSGNEGERFNLTAKDGENKIVVEFTGNYLTGEEYNLAKSNTDIVDGTVFKLGSNFYVRIGDQYYEFVQRNDRSGEWGAFTDAFGKTPS